MSLGPLARVFWHLGMSMYQENARLRDPRSARRAVAASMAAGLAKYVESAEDPSAYYARILAAPFGEILDRMAVSDNLPDRLKAEAARLSQSIRTFLRQVEHVEGG